LIVIRDDEQVRRLFSNEGAQEPVLTQVRILKLIDADEPIEAPKLLRDRGSRGNNLMCEPDEKREVCGARGKKNISVRMKHRREPFWGLRRRCPRGIVAVALLKHVLDEIENASRLYLRRHATLGHGLEHIGKPVSVVCNDGEVWPKTNEFPVLTENFCGKRMKCGQHYA